MAFSPIVGMEKLEEFCPRTSSKQELSWHGQSPYLLQRPLTAHLLTAPSYTLRTNSLQFYRCGGAIVTNRRLTPYNFGYWTWNACFYVLHLQYTVFHFSPIDSLLYRVDSYMKQSTWFCLGMTVSTSLGTSTDMLDSRRWLQYLNRHNVSHQIILI